MTIWTPTLKLEDGSKYEQIARAIERDIADDILKPGDRLPPQRKLAKQLHVTIGTIGRAYALAERRGLTKSEVGRGCFVSPSSRFVVDGKSSRLIIDLGVNFPPDVNDDRLFQETLNELACRRNLDQLFGALPVDGLLHQRTAAAQWLEPRIGCSEEDVLVCTGMQSALIASLSSQTIPGDSVFVESQTFPGILSVMRLLRLNPVPIPMDAEGILPDQIAGGHAKVMYLNPTNQNPTSTTLSMSRRKAVAKVIAKYGIRLLEDDTYGQLCPDSPPTISSLIPDQSILVASLSKSLTVGLRLAFLRAPKTIRDQIISRLQATSFFPSSISLEIACKWITEGTADRLVQLRIAEANRRRKIATEFLPSTLMRSLPALNHVWLNLPEGWTSKSLCRAAAENGVIVLPSESFSPTPECATNSVRVAIGAARTDEELKVGLEKIARLLDSENVLQSTRF